MRFFFYGTLIAGEANPAIRAARARLVPLGPASVRGALHAIADPQGWFPALVAGAGEVRGLLFAAGPAFTAADLATLDAFENARPDDPAGSDYRRESIEVETAQGPMAAQAYLWNRPVAGAPPIPHGDFARWLRETGHAAYRD